MAAIYMSIFASLARVFFVLLCWQVCEIWGPQQSTASFSGVGPATHAPHLLPFALSPAPDPCFHLTSLRAAGGQCTDIPDGERARDRTMGKSFGALSLSRCGSGCCASKKQQQLCGLAREREPSAGNGNTRKHEAGVVRTHGDPLCSFFFSFSSSVPTSGYRPAA